MLIATCEGSNSFRVCWKNVMAERKFIHAEGGKYSMEEKKALGKLCKKYKHEFDVRAAELSKKVINYNKMKKHTKPILREGYIARAVRDFYLDLRNVEHDDPNLQAVVKLGKRCHEQLLSSESTCKINVGPSKFKYHKPGAGRRTIIPDVREALFDWFIGIRSTLKARLPRKMFKTQFQVFYDKWLAQQPEEIPVEKRIVFSKRWIKNRMRKYEASLSHANDFKSSKQKEKNVCLST